MPWVITGAAILVAGVVVAASLGVLIFARKPSTVTASPIQTRPSTVSPTPGADIIDLAGTRWHDTTNVNISTKTYNFTPGGNINGNASDIWKQDGRKVILEFTDGYARYEGTINGDQIDYTAHNKVNFSWSATLIRDK